MSNIDGRPDWDSIEDWLKLISENTAPGSGGLTDTELRATPVPVSGTVDVGTVTTLPAITGAVTVSSGTINVGTVTTLPSITGAVTVSSGAITETNSGTIKTAVEAINTKLTSGTDIGDVTINNAAGSGVYVQPGTAAVFQTQSNSANIATETTLGTVHGHLDSIDTKMVNGTDIGDVTINNASGASAVNIQDGGNTITVDGTVDVSDKAARLLGKTTLYDVLAGGTIAAVAQTVGLECLSIATVAVQIIGTWEGTIDFEGTIDSTNWIPVRAVQFGGTLLSETSENGIFFIQVAGLINVRVYCSAWTQGTATVYMEGTTATNAVTIANALPVGTNTIGAVDVNDLDRVEILNRKTAEEMLPLILAELKVITEVLVQGLEGRIRPMRTIFPDDLRQEFLRES